MTHWAWAGLTVVAAGLGAALVQWLAAQVALRPLRRGSPNHWTERARLASPVFQTLTLGPVIMVVIWADTLGGHIPRWSPWAESLGNVAVVIAAFVGAGAVARPIEAQVRQRPVSPPDWLRGWGVLCLLVVPHITSVLVLASIMPNQFDRTVAALMAMGLFIVLVLDLGGALVLARWVGLLRPAPERLRTVAALAAQRLGVPSSTCYLIRWKIANALAFPFTPTIAVTEAALESLEDDQLVAVCLHELAHLSEPRRIQLLRLATQLLWLPIALVSPVIEQWDFWGLLIALGWTGLALWLTRKVSFAMEPKADAIGRAHEGPPGTYARALERLYVINLVPAVGGMQTATHPELYDRLLAAGVTPAYPRPKPPPRWPGRLALAILVLGAGGMRVGWMWLGSCL